MVYFSISSLPTSNSIKSYSCTQSILITLHHLLHTVGIQTAHALLFLSVSIKHALLISDIKLYSNTTRNIHSTITCASYSSKVLQPIFHRISSFPTFSTSQSHLSIPFCLISIHHILYDTMYASAPHPYIILLTTIPFHSSLPTTYLLQNLATKPCTPFASTIQTCLYCYYQVLVFYHSHQTSICSLSSLHLYKPLFPFSLTIFGNASTNAIKNHLLDGTDHCSPSDTHHLHTGTQPGFFAQSLHRYSQTYI